MLELKNISKTYQTGDQSVKALDGVDLQFEDHGFVFILGRSGSGKSTLLHIIGGLDSPTTGEIVLDGRSGKDFRESDWNSYRKNSIGFVFQEYNLLPEFNVYDNIAIAAEIKKIKLEKAGIDELLSRVGLQDTGKRKISQLSGGQRQRVAIARALAKQPRIILADEPTGALDQTTGGEILDLLKELSETVLVIVVTHDRDYAEQYGDRIIEIADGKIIADNVK